MFKRPEELIMAALAVLWIVFSHFAAAYLGAPLTTALLVALLTTLWAGVLFLLWKYDHAGFVWPLFLGLLTACWWPWLDWHAAATALAAGDTVLPWYVSWPAKTVFILLPAVAGYALKIKHRRHRRELPHID